MEDTSGFAYELGQRAVPDVTAQHIVTCFAAHIRENEVGIDEPFKMMSRVRILGVSVAYAPYSAAVCEFEGNELRSDQLRKCLPPKKYGQDPNFDTEASL